MGKQREKKSKWADIPSDFREAVYGMNRDEIIDRIADVALEAEEILSKEKDDQDLKTARATAAAAGEIYRNTRKMLKLKTAFCKQVIDDKGGYIPKPTTSSP